MRQPSAWTVVLMQLRTSRGDRLHDPFLSCVQLDTATRQQPGPPPPEQANTVKTELTGGRPLAPSKAADTSARSQLRRTAYETCGTCRPCVCDRKLGTPTRSRRSHSARTARSERRSNRRHTANAIR